MDNNNKPPSPIMDKIHELAISKPEYQIHQILAELNVSYGTYKNLCRSHLSISKYRKHVLGNAFTVSPERRLQLINNLQKIRDSL